MLLQLDAYDMCNCDSSDDVATSIVRSFVRLIKRTTRGTDASYESANRCPIGVAVQIVRNFGRWIDCARWEPTHARTNGEQ